MNDLAGRLHRRLPVLELLDQRGVKSVNEALRYAPGVVTEQKGAAVTMYDKDAPTGSGWWHWVVFDLPAGTLEIPANAGNITSGLMPENAIQSRTDFGSYGYGGPCPPEGHGFHEYLITVYALDTDKLELGRDASPALVGYMINAHLLGKASIVIYAKR